MLRYFLLVPLLLGFVGPPLSAQTVTNVRTGSARPDASKVVLMVGPQAVLYRKVRLFDVSAGGLEREMGYRVGLHWEIPLRYNKDLVVGLDLLTEQGAIVDYNDEELNFNRRFFDSPGTGEQLENIDNGRLSFRETYARFLTTYRYRMLRWSLDAGLGINIRTNPREEFTLRYDRTVRGFVDNQTGLTALLDEPLTFTEMGTRDNANGFLGLVLGVGFEPINRLHLRLEVEQSIHITSRFAGQLTRRARAGLTVGYRLLPLR